MRTKPIIALVAGIALVVFNAILFAAAHPSPPAITVRHIKSVRSGNWVTATFEITNHTGRWYWVGATSVEVHDGPIWKKCFQFDSTPGPVVDSHDAAFCTLDMADLPVDSSLRLRLIAEKDLSGLDGLFNRLQLRYLKHEKVSLNAFSKASKLFDSGKAIQIVSDEFIESGSNHIDQAALEK